MICCESVVKMLCIWLFFSTVRSQQILSNILLLTSYYELLLVGKKLISYVDFKLEPIITYQI